MTTRAYSPSQRTRTRGPSSCTIASISTSCANCSATTHQSPPWRSHATAPCSPRHPRKGQSSACTASRGGTKCGHSAAEWSTPRFGRWRLGAKLRPPGKLRMTPASPARSFWRRLVRREPCTCGASRARRGISRRRTSITRNAPSTKSRIIHENATRPTAF